MPSLSPATRINFPPLLAVVLVTVMVSGCVEFSPFETDLSDDERDQNAKHIARLADIPAPVGPLRFAVISDSHQNYDELTDVVDAINARDDLSFVIHLGDMTQTGLRQDYRWTLECLKQIDVPFVAEIGNHDTLSNGRDVFRNMYGAYDYTFDYGGTRFVLFNGNQLEFQRAIPDLDWLSEVTAPSSDVTSVIVAGHQRPPDGAYEVVLSDNNVSALITAHLHSFTTGSVSDVPAFEVGTAKSRQWAMFTVDNGAVSAASCIASLCTPELL